MTTKCQFTLAMIFGVITKPIVFRCRKKNTNVSLSQKFNIKLQQKKIDDNIDPQYSIHVPQTS